MYRWLGPARPGWGDSSILWVAYPCRCCGVYAWIMHGTPQQRRCGDCL